jgi:uroporphyrin-III C-methyltransferase
MKGKVYLVGAGPGSPELLTLKALRVLEACDVVLHDDLVSREILAFAPSRARVYNVGKRCGPKKTTQREINASLVSHARAGKLVVRLKGGDPLIFGRAGEEIEALREAGIDFEIVPGVTAASVAAASARIPLTDRRHASAVVFLTAHPCRGKLRADWRMAATPGATVVLYMPGNDYEALAADLCDVGIDLGTPCVIVSRASTPQERIHRTTIGELPAGPGLAAPAVLIIGSAAAMDGRAEESPNDFVRRIAISSAIAHAPYPNAALVR